ncbi:anti-sigma factor [Methylobacterium gnaphalii]|uniref:Regulator of SigK n=1 Tax=Methylobacterium gnaphalii TaxID=1010610 RepID=A0A512JMA0_9HYPH|nr:anti-sigma factor [Methylobacterium gnaphalii]GEP11091.1 DNA-directed RNA polymerase sigma-70 factor [Methylobacterium gnaphalii]GJD67096.1 hypothetical protein MMMDOFMJ_0009 [Methylobacterium gnaphalii]GLS50369.1 DNA-directed RNA polymerase sigma-70 factor [Methylobacterium gnaphalii]
MSGPDESGPSGLPETELRAAEYVLGTLDAQERAAVEREATADPELRARLADWERRLSSLMGAVPAVAPPPELKAALMKSLPARRPDQIIILARQVRRWRFATAGAGLLAAGLAAFLAIGDRGPEAGRYVAVVQSGGATPALIVRVDTAAGTAQVRPIGAEAPGGRSLQLWYVDAAGPKPLGLVQPAASRVKLPPGASADGIIAVSVEPPGGSPTGQPTGPVVYTGKLIAE